MPVNVQGRTNADPALQLAEAIRQRRGVLFVGAGVSISVGLPSWETLIRQMASELGLDESSPRGVTGFTR